jgi:hypothetical protein
MLRVFSYVCHVKPLAARSDVEAAASRQPRMQNPQHLPSSSRK